MIQKAGLFYMCCMGFCAFLGTAAFAQVTMVPLSHHVSTPNIDIESELFSSASAGDVDKMTRLIETYGIPINIRQHSNIEFGFKPTLVMVAAANGQLDVVKKLVELGADLNLFSILNGYETTPSYLLFPSDHHYRPGHRALMLAAMNGHAHVVEYLIKTQGPQAAEEENGQGETAFQLAIENGHLRVIEVLLEAGVSPGFKWPEYWKVPYHDGLSTEHNIELTQKVESRGRLNLSPLEAKERRRYLRGYKKYFERSPLGIAVLSHQHRIAQFLVAAGAELNEYTIEFTRNQQKEVTRLAAAASAESVTRATGLECKAASFQRMGDELEWDLTAREQVAEIQNEIQTAGDFGKNGSDVAGVVTEYLTGQKMNRSAQVIKPSDSTACTDSTAQTNPTSSTTLTTQTNSASSTSFTGATASTGVVENAMSDGTTPVGPTSFNAQAANVQMPRCSRRLF